MSDLISRQAAIEKTDCLYRDTKNDEAFMITGYNHALSDMRAILKSLPSVQEQQWIPVTERLPKEKEDVLLAFKQNMIVGFWENVLGDDVTWYANSGDGWMTGTEAVDNDGIPLAWMPLPSAYEGENR